MNIVARDYAAYLVKYRSEVLEYLNNIKVIIVEKLI